MKLEDIAREILGQCLAGRTLQIARIVSARYDRALSQHGLTAHQLTLLSMIALRQPIAARDMLPYLKMEQSTLSRNLERMAARGWLAFSPDETDSRTRLAQLTAAGQHTLRSAHQSWRETQSWARLEFGQDGAEAIIALAHALNPLLPR